ncbi:hypothetical protein [Haladaptatus sp. DYF46]|uniref:hypothetical protein n=1 Tax=Haladaptatus sp. DYF46 TaxID=2886041 RepID=UPI001E4FF319|nr:hypothetical protein [Haladaptatus sp. DYF46]
MVEVGTIERKQLGIALLLVASLTLSVGVPIGNVPLGFGIGVAFEVAKLVVEAVRCVGSGHRRDRFITSSTSVSS